MRAGQPAVSVNGNTLSSWTFDAMNVLSWTDAAGGSAWLQLMVLPGGPVFMGTLASADAEAAAPGARQAPGLALCTCSWGTKYTHLTGGAMSN